MEEQHKGHNIKAEKQPHENWQLPPFDPTTNFSLLGYIIDKFEKKDVLKSKVDLILDK